MIHASLSDSLVQGNTSPLASSMLDTCMQVPASGMKGEALPYKMESDEAIMGAIVVCFVLIVLALKKGACSIKAFLKDVFIIKGRPSFFEEKVSLSSVSLTALCVTTFITSGIALYQYLVVPNMVQEVSQLWALSFYSLAFALLIIGKSILYGFINWVFFPRDKNKCWKQCYWELIAASGVVLFPTILYVVFLDSAFQISVYLLLTILVLFKILLFYRLIGNFFAHFYGILHLFVYFCALEIIPDLLLWKGVVIFNNEFLNF